MPYPGEHAARQESPDAFVESSFKRYVKHLPTGVSFIMGRPKDKDQMQVQSVRFNINQWSVPEAKKWLKENDYRVGQFEEAVAKHWSVAVPITKVAAEERLAFGWASVVTDDCGETLVDHQDDRISIPELEKAAYTYVQHSREATEMHVRKGIAELVESVVITPEKREAMGIGAGVSGWWVGFHVSDPDVWSKVKDGTYTEFSIGGSAKRKAVA